MKTNWRLGLSMTIAAISGANIGLGLMLAYTQAGRLAGESLPLVLGAIIGALLGIGVALIAHRLPRKVVLGFVAGVSIVATLFGQSTAADAAESDDGPNRCAVFTITTDRTDADGRDFYARPTPGARGSQQKPLRIDVSEGATIDIRIATLAEEPYERVVVNAQVVAPVGSRRLTFDAEQFTFEGKVVSGSLTTASGGMQGLRIESNGRTETLPLGVVEFSGWFDDRECEFSLHVQLVAPSLATLAGRLAAGMTALGTVGLGAVSVSSLADQSPLNRARLSRGNVPVETSDWYRPSGGEAADQAGSGSATDLLDAWLPRPFAVLARGAPGDDPDEPIVQAFIEANGHAHKGVVPDEPLTLVVWFGPMDEKTRDRLRRDPDRAAVEPRALHATLTWGRGVQNRVLHLPTDRSLFSDELRFPLGTLGEGDALKIELVFWSSAKRVFEWVVITAKARLDERADSELKITSTAKYRDRKAVKRPAADEVTSFLSTEAGMFRPAGGKTSALDLDQLDRIATNFSQNIAGPLRMERVVDWSGALVRQALHQMACDGAELFDELNNEETPIAERIQYWGRRAVGTIPFEFVYDRGTPTEDFELRQPCIDALLREPRARSTSCGCKPASQLTADERSANPVLCPSGFWGLSRVIERFEHSAGEDVVNRFGHAGRDDPWLPEPSSLLLTTSDLVTAHEKASGHDLAAGLETKAPNVAVRRVADWTAWQDVVRRGVSASDLLVVIPHQEGGALETGGEHLSASRDLSAMLPSDKHVLLLLGCDTLGPVNENFKSFAVRFQEAGAPVVVGAHGQLYPEQMVTLVPELIEQLCAGASAGESFGDAMRLVRRCLFAKGFVVALALAGVGDADWQFEPRVRGSAKGSVVASWQPRKVKEPVGEPDATQWSFPAVKEVADQPVTAYSQSVTTSAAWWSAQTSDDEASDSGDIASREGETEPAESAGQVWWQSNLERTPAPLGADRGQKQTAVDGVPAGSAAEPDEPAAKWWHDANGPDQVEGDDVQH